MRWRSVATGAVLAAAVVYSGYLVRQSIHADRTAQPKVVGQRTTVTEGYLPGDMAPNFSLTATDGQTISLASLRGHPVWLNFWATWCPHCRQELALIEKEHQRYGTGLIIVGIDMEQSRAQVQAFVRARGLTYPTLLDTQGSVSAAFNVHGLPTSVFIAPNGIIKAVRAGAVTSPLEAQAYIDQIVSRSGQSRRVGLIPAAAKLAK